jgi:hypothetical protein
MPMFSWGLDEALEAIGLFYAVLLALLILLVIMERGLTEIPKPHTRLVRELSRQWLNGTNCEHEPVIVCLGRTPRGSQPASAANCTSPPTRLSASCV